jgi:hypothetical protein
MDRPDSCISKKEMGECKNYPSSHWSIFARWSSYQRFYSNNRRESMNDTAVHLRHCFQGEHENSCKYGEDKTCPAKPNIVISQSDWTPGNPCKGCAMNGKYGECHEACNRDKEPARKLLEYLIAVTHKRLEIYKNCPDEGATNIWLEILQSMLKQLEKKQ